jgi:predicted MFS family arabinose efflux permease
MHDGRGQPTQTRDGAMPNRSASNRPIHDRPGCDSPSNRASFRSLAWSNLAAQAAEQIALSATPLVAVLALNAGAGVTGFLAAAQTLPFLLLSFPAGLVADRTSRKRMMVLAEALRATMLLVLALLTALGLVSVPLLAVLGFLATTGTVAFGVAVPALVPTLVPREKLASANGRLELARSTAFAAGPAVGGAVVGWVGASPAFILAAVLSMIAVLCLARVPEPPRAPPPRRHIVRDMRDGAGFVWNHRLLRPILLTAVGWNLAWIMLQAAYVPYAASVLGLTAAGIGVTLASFGGGMMFGALVAPRIMRGLSVGTAIVAGPAVSVAAAGLMMATVAMPSAMLVGLAFFLFGAGPLVWTVSTTTLRQAVAPDFMLGRVSALFLMASTGARPIGAAFGGLIGAGFGPTTCIVVASCGFVVQLAVIVCSPVPRLVRLPDPGDREGGAPLKAAA